ncbi:MAG: MotA/TolQ/ExbB proton channel family protein [Magnetococcales bacterium]|nr:MotA/TolQ/ExbB proton channel family protein [Magnetococcales bacterium]
MTDSASWLTWWLHADGVVQAIFLLLALLSVFGWTIILHKWRQLNHLLDRERRGRQALEAGHWPEPAALLLGRPAAPGPHQEAGAAHAVKEKRVELESGLTFLASIGVSTPFIGLLGTVWGIMHALAGLGQMTALSMEVVAGPVAEALVATAAGLFAAIPAAVGYNLLIRRLRRLITLAEGNLLRQMMRPEGGSNGRKPV